MPNIRQICRVVTTNKWFELGITIVIILNSILIGIELSYENTAIKTTQSIILAIFTLEIIMRFIAADSIKSFFKDGWNNFDLSLVLLGYIPESIFGEGSAMMALRVLRVFRVLRLLRSAKEIKLIVTVFVKSMKTLFYNVVLFVIFVYLFAIVGVLLFKLPNPLYLQGEELHQYKEYVKVAPNAPVNSPDPFGTLGESMFTLFRELTGEDWTDIRYNLITAYEHGLISTTPEVITTYHVIWFILSAFLLLNLVVGAIVNNYQIAMEMDKKEETKNKEKRNEM